MSNYTIPPQMQRDIDREADDRVDAGDPDYIIVTHMDRETTYTLHAPTNFEDQAKVGQPCDSADRRLVAKRGGKCVAILHYTLGPYHVSCQSNGKLKTMHVSKNGVYVEYIEVNTEFLRQGEAKKILSVLQQLEGDVVLNGFAIHQASAKLLQHSNWQKLPKEEDLPNDPITRTEEQWFNTPLKNIVKLAHPQGMDI